MNSSAGVYDPFKLGGFRVDVHGLEAEDHARKRRFPVDVWAPSSEGPYPLVIFSHYSGGNRRSSTFLTTHLASHGYVVAALDHSEVVAPELSRPDGETASQRAARIESIIASRVPDVRFLIDYMLAGVTAGGVALAPDRIGLVGHSFGGWTVLATAEADNRVRSIVAMAPGGSEHPKPGTLSTRLTFAWGRDVPTLYLAAENDVPVPPANVLDVYQRTPGPKRIAVLRRADHQHFVDDVEGEHEALRRMTLPGEAAWMPGSMRPISELSTGEQAHTFVRGLALAHFDATLKGSAAAERFFKGGVEAELAARNVDAQVLSNGGASLGGG